ncbi:hypothetical protein H6P81_006846 [Aristolochia fimbriata]|uniref:Transcription factor MYB98 n=1 Tax=Aristolochia fimbriata TaxID=158543 RepID=A0AAV7F1X0_ARIFI|nr:hypothetical protein H6P81_006846 [Aristolochia fimbriata]
MAFMERGVGALGHGFLEKATHHLLRPAPLFTPLDWFRSTTSNGFTQTRDLLIYGDYQEAAPANNGFYLPPASNGMVEERSFVDGLFVHGHEGVGNEGGARRNGCRNAAAGKKGGGGSTSALVKGQWTAEEDSLLLKLVKQHGVRKWSVIAQHLVGRIGKQCRERWHNHLRPDIKKDTWSEEEEKLLVEAHQKVGNKWAEIAKRIPGRTENSIKNHWNATKRRQNSRRKTRKTTAQTGKPPHPCVLQDYIRTMYHHHSKSSHPSSNINNNNNIPISSNHSSTTTNESHDHLELLNTTTSTTAAALLNNYKDEDHLLQHYFYGAAADSSMGSSTRAPPPHEAMLGVEQLEQVLLSDDSVQQLMEMDELAFFVPSPVIDYYSDNSTTHHFHDQQDAATTLTSSHLHSDLYISYLLNGSADSGTSNEEEMKTNIYTKLPIHEQDHDEAFPRRREEMDLIEMVSNSSSKKIQSRCSSSQYYS